MQNYIYNAKFSSNILIVGRTGCGKTYFTQTRAINKSFGLLEKVEWVSSIKLQAEREAEIESCFSCNVEFYYPKGLRRLENFKAHWNTVNTYSSNEEDVANSGFGEKSKRS